MGYALVVNTTSIFHIAHGGVYVAGGYIAYALIALAHLPLWLSIILVIIGCGGIGIACEFLVYRPMRRINSHSAAFLLASIGLTYIIQNVCALFAGTYPKTFSQQLKVTLTFGDIYIQNIHIILFAVCAVIFVLLYYVLNHTSIGLSIKTVSSNPRLATVWGMNPSWISLVVIAIASLIVAPVSFLHAMDIGSVPFAGWDMITLAMMAYIIGGIGSVLSSGLAGLGIGIISSIITWKMPSVWAPLIVFSIVYIFMWLRPKGVLGKKIWTYEV
jgi:branched-chain amino acid transport system permease protein